MEYSNIFKRGKFSIFEPWIVFSFHDLSRLILNNGNILSKELEQLRHETKIACEYQWDNSHFLVSNSYGDMFIFNYHDGNLHVWDMHDFVISHIQIDSNSDKDTQIQLLKEVSDSMNIYSQGKIHCSDCGNIENYKDIISHRHFAGIYCDNCWNTKWKEIEAKENYN